MTNFSPPSALARARLTTHRAVATTLLLLALATCWLLTLAPGASAQVTTVGPVTVGLAPRVGATIGPKPASYANPEGHPVLHGASTYAIYWDPTDHYHGDWQQGVDQFMQDIGSESGALRTVFAVDAQYTDKTNVPATYRSVFHGAYTDTAPYPANACTDPSPLSPADRIGPGATSVCLTSAQVAAQVESFIALHALPKGMSTVYYVLLPPGATVCLDAGTSTGHCSDYSNPESYEHSFCSYHAAINPGGLPTGDGNAILYGVIPWVAGGAADPHMTEADQKRAAYECQDGGFDPTSQPPGAVEKAKEKTKSEQEKFEEGTLEEKAKIEKAEALAGPHIQEPNQIECPTQDGGCDYGLFDLITNQIALQHQNIVTNPLLNAWQDSVKAENTDECRFVFSPTRGGSLTASPETFAGTLYNQILAAHNYYVNDAFSLAAVMLPFPGVPCLTGVALLPTFTAPNTVNSGEVVGFNGMESDIALNAGINYPGGGAPATTYATYTWSFGDGTTATGFAPGAPTCEAPWLSPCAASAFHSYIYGGTYPVKLTVTDVAGNTSFVEHDVTVNGPPPPAPPPAPGSTPPGTGTGTGTGTGSGSGSGTGVTPLNPVASAAIVSHSLRKALRKGVTVSYSVNQQVAGHFDVLIGQALARRLKIGGAPAVGLPAGTPPQIVIAKALLVTTKGGHSTLNIKFSKAVAARLKHAHSVPLLLRLTVRSAASKNPATTTVLSAITLN